MLFTPCRLRPGAWLDETGWCAGLSILCGVYGRRSLVGEPFDRVIKGHPRMPRCLPPRCRRPGHQRAGERAKNNAHVIPAGLRVPEHRGAAIRAKMKFDFSPRVAGAHVDLARSLDTHLILREKGDDAEG